MINFRKLRWNDVDWIHMAQNRDHWRALANTVMTLLVPWNVGNVLSSWATGRFSRWTQFHRVRYYKYSSWTEETKKYENSLHGVRVKQRESYFLTSRTTIQLLARKLAWAVTCLTCILEVLCSNPKRSLNIMTMDFSWVSSAHTNAGIVPQIRPQLRPPTSFAVHRSAILPFDTTSVHLYTETQHR
jgi:hypothetical protein